MSSTHHHLLLDFFWQVISGPACINNNSNMIVLKTNVVKWPGTSFCFVRRSSISCQIFHETEIIGQKSGSG
jgi:hypothetical protein